MSTRINLLPWREERRRRRQQAFLGMLGAAVVIGAGIWFAGLTYLNQQIEHQENRNDMLRAEIRELDRQITRISELEATRDQLNARMEVIQDLQRGRPQIVHMFEEMVLTLPDGLYLNSLRQQGDRLTLSGVGQSNARVSSYMERLEASDWLRNPELDVIEVRREDGLRLSDFTLRTQQTSPLTSDENDNGEDAE
ncbi:PilN domain-containing protein [Methylonatrum kenyense]|uniref:PilN domain-containing protein n=1 Tax=Methylonatrum kenyense TaxID=455253 RepID=UPI0020BF5C90|nr:PilN domain-containing protein [Methylonatrum kenyense]MCK8516850.1 PilN domain-containing protein [Methylonatrum kenyense]